MVQAPIYNGGATVKKSTAIFRPSKMYYFIMRLSYILAVFEIS